MGGEPGEAVNGEDVAPGLGKAALAHPLHRAQDEAPGAAPNGLERRRRVEEQLAPLAGQQGGRRQVEMRPPRCRDDEVEAAGVLGEPGGKRWQLGRLPRVSGRGIDHLADARSGRGASPGPLEQGLDFAADRVVEHEVVAFEADEWLVGLFDTQIAADRGDLVLVEIHRPEGFQKRYGGVVGGRRAPAGEHEGMPRVVGQAVGGERFGEQGCLRRDNDRRLRPVEAVGKQPGGRDRNQQDPGGDDLSPSWRA